MKVMEQHAYYTRNEQNAESILHLKCRTILNTQTQASQTLFERYSSCFPVDKLFRDLVTVTLLLKTSLQGIGSCLELKYESTVYYLDQQMDNIYTYIYVCVCVY